MYQAPLEDIRFVMKELADLDSVLSLPAYSDFDSETIDAILQENARFVEERIVPLNRAGDLQPARWQNGEVETTPGFKEAFAEFARSGWQGLQHSSEWGGQGLPKLLSAATTEALNAANLSFALCPLLTDGVIEALTTAGSPELCERFIPPMVAGRWTGTMNLTEPQAGSDLALLSTRALPQDDGSYRLHGQKIFITFGEHDMAENIIHLVLARTPDAPKGVKGISLFLVPKFLVNEDGGLGARNDVWCASLEHKLGIHGSPTSVLLYGSGKGEVGEGAVGYLVGQENRGLETMFIMMNAARYAVGVQGVALGERALQQAQAYATERLQGQAPESSSGPVSIDQHPDVQRMLLTMRALTEGARATALWAAGLADIAKQHPAEKERALRKAMYEYLVPVVKAFSTEVAVEITSLGVQIHGGMGYIEETGAAQFYRDARILPIYEGTTAIQANDFIGRKILRDGGGAALAIGGLVRETVAQLGLAVAGGGRDAVALGLIRGRLDAAVNAQAEAIAHVLEQARHDPRGVYMGSVPMLMLAGIVQGGWHMARAALAVHQRVGAGEASDFDQRKLATAVFYAAHLLPRAQAYRDAVLAGGLAAEYAGTVYKK